MSVCEVLLWEFLRRRKSGETFGREGSSFDCGVLGGEFRGANHLPSAVVLACSSRGSNGLKFRNDSVGVSCFAQACGNMTGK